VFFTFALLINNMRENARKWVSLWLMAGCAMVFFQVVVGGVTRLTESGLSITEWKPIKGIVPPLNAEEWQKEFERYQKITQYKAIHYDMSLSEFKWIYFWEYFHRFWARFMGIAFAVPFAFFLFKKWLDRSLLKRIGVLFLWGGIIGVYGWIMVRSGLSGIYVPPFHLSIHLLLALSLFAYLVNLTLYVYRGGRPTQGASSASSKQWLLLLTVLIFVQIVFGGMVSGMKAGLVYPTWPLMHGEFFPSAIVRESFNWEVFFQYQAADYWGRSLIQFLHRTMAYFIFLLSILIVWKEAKQHGFANLLPPYKWLLLAVTLQAVIGIVTVLNCVGKIPVFWGVMHQVGAMVLLANLSWIWHYPFRQ
jgi:cytochrome c oxidase assembly protein subunit 15